MAQEEHQQPQRLVTPGQPDTYIPERKSLSAAPHVSDDAYLKNKILINAHKMHKLEQAVRKEAQS